MGSGWGLVAKTQSIKKAFRRFKREGTCVYLWLVLTDIWQKSTQYCKAIILQFKIHKLKEK